MSGDISMLAHTKFIHIKCHQVNCGNVWSGDGKELNPSGIPENSISSDLADLLCIMIYCLCFKGGGGSSEELSDYSQNYFKICHGI